MVYGNKELVIVGIIDLWILCVFVVVFIVVVVVYVVIEVYLLVL